MTMSTKYDNGALTVTRFYDAPRADVFDAWIEAAKVQLWWGCADTTKVRSEIDACIGGDYVHHMTIHGNEIAQRAKFTEYDPPKRLAYESEETQWSGSMHVAVDFEEKDGGTQVTLVHSRLPDELSNVVTGGWSAAFEKLEKFLQKEA